MDVKTLLLVALAILGAAFLVIWWRSVRQRRLREPDLEVRPSALHTAIGFGTNFFDTLGIGSFAPTTSLFKLWHVVRDELIPGTLNVGHTPPVIAQAFIFVAIIQVDLATLVPMIAASVAGAWLGAGVVVRLPRRPIQLGIAVALLLAAGFFVMTNLGLFPAGGDARGLHGWALGLAVTVNFVLGALGTLGIGVYAPIMVMVSLLGMNPQVAFPIMMGSCAFLMPVASMRFVQKGKYSLRPALGLTFGGVPAVLIAALIVKSLPVDKLRWLVAAVVLYTAIVMLRSALSNGERKRSTELP
jgi:uncharacterized membrane protein YfcA